MKKKQDNQLRVFTFLQDRFTTGKPFTKEELRAVTDWTPSSFATYWGKQYKAFIVPISGPAARGTAGEPLYRVTDGFRRYARWKSFREYVTQVRAITSSDYRYREHPQVLIYEFYMPLTNETALRTTLDALFYKNTLLARLRGLDISQVTGKFRMRSGESVDLYLERVAAWLSTKFVGYSISHVSGRFRAESLSTMHEAANLEAKGLRYLVDETTAVTRFIFPCDDDAEQVAWFFKELFINAIIQLVNGEDEIWMVESGLRNCLHTWKVGSSD